jgi:hypothetical protein
MGDVGIGLAATLAPKRRPPVGSTLKPAQHARSARQYLNALIRSRPHR